MKNIWQLQDAKSKFSDVVNKAITQGIQIVTKHGKQAVVILSVEEYQKLVQKNQSLSQFLLNSPLANSTLDITRDPDLPRDIGIDA